jgi:hypothetical protein
MTGGRRKIFLRVNFVEKKKENTQVGVATLPPDAAEPSAAAAAAGAAALPSTASPPHILISS